MRRLPKIFLVGLGLVLGLALVEAGLRLFFWAADQRLFNLSPQRTTLRWQDDPILGRRFLPDQAGWFVTPSREYFTRIEINSQGFRDSEHTLEKSEGTFRILLIGDSFVENLQVPLEQTLFKQLERNLAGLVADKKIEVIAMGLGDSGTAQHYLALKEFGLTYQPDLVVHYFFTGNDVKNNSPQLQADPHRPYFKLVNGELRLLPFTPRSQIPKYKLLSLIKSNFRVVELLLDLKGKLLAPRIADYPVDYHLYDQNYNQDYEQAWDLTKALILAIKNLARENGADYLLVSSANNEQVSGDVWRQLQNQYPAMKVPALEPEKPDKILSDFCQKESLGCFFLLPSFRIFVQGRDPDPLTHYRLDGHWTKEGTNLVAQLLTAYLAAYFSIK